LLFLIGCTHQSAATPQRIAVLRFENLSSDPSLDWMGRAASEIISHEIGAGPTSVLTAAALHANPLAQLRPVSAPGESAERTAAIAEGATRIVIGQISRVGNRLLLDIAVNDPVTGKTVDSFTLASPNAGDVYGLSDAAARRLANPVTPFDTQNDAAIASWSRGIEDSDYSQAVSDYEAAVHADPNFASAWLAWSGTAAAHGDRAGAQKILEDAQQHAANFSELNRARLKLAGAKLSGDRAALLAAMNNLGRLLPDDVDNTRAVGDLNFSARQYPAAIAAYRRLTQLAPNSPIAWNQLGYALMDAGDHDGAISALQTYQRLAPNDPNPIDSQGDVEFAFGRFTDAAKLYDQAAAKDADFHNSADLYKAAVAQLFTGDTAGAQKKFEVYANARRGAKDSALPFRTAQWLFLSGKHEEARNSLVQLIAGNDPQFTAPQFRSILLTQMAAWDLQLGQHDRALQDSSDAMKTGAASPNTLIVRFACEDARTPADWSARADKMLASPQLAQIKPVALAYALYWSKQWAAAEPAWKALVDRANADDVVSPVVYAQILVELKRVHDAEPFVRLFPVLHPTEPQEFLAMAVPQIFATRAVVFASQGKTSEADASSKIFQTLWSH
jgi:tetratricopeptide (TPR) repeat protein